MTTRSQAAGPSDEAVAECDEEHSRQSLYSNGNKSISGKKEELDIYATLDIDEDDHEDKFFDRSLDELRTKSWIDRGIFWVMRMSKKIYHRLYGDDLPPSEMLRTLCLAMTLFFMIGGYWLLRSLKDPVLTALCGVSAIPKAKMMSVFVVLGVVSIYNRLLDSDIARHKLFYLFGSFYFCLFFIISVLLYHPTIGLPNEQADPYRILGWISYCSIESFGSVMVSLFWSFANSNFSFKTAKSSYGVLVAMAQIGSIIGPTIVNEYAGTKGPAWCYMVGATFMLLLQGTMYMYIRIYGAQQRNASGTEEEAKKKSSDENPAKKKAGILEGLHLFWEHHYVKGIFAISCLFMVEVTIIDYTMKVLARDYFATLHPCWEGQSCFSTTEGVVNGMSRQATAAFTTFMGLFGQATNALSLVLSLFGTSAVIRYLGLRLTLLVFPSLCLVVIVFVRFYPTLYVVFGAMMTLKACSYALNNPTKELLYQPTSPAVRYKAKSWIDIFGARGAKAMGSVITNAFADSASSLIQNGSLVGMAVASFLIWNARYMGRKFDEYQEDGYIVGSTDNENRNNVTVVLSQEEGNVQMAKMQNEGDSTSCALDDDDEEGNEDDGKLEGKEATADVARV
eukprot:CAMPEP_0194213862 /NCGR_PEP_ID=MMETSP0156-20130528/14733_1 /TAXON_ID=33649 /ORGANISM="Thalassionema nitzschioides, Strain L26-B" /LENGTH=620 /DNA_ID=CAMNT_0038941995 /DNA_START=187 /DNA_END=2049 /DNA_ORIENTATION=-